MISIRPRLRDLVSPEASRTTTQLEAMGADVTRAPGFVVGIRMSGSGARAVLCRALVDFVVRLEPLVDRVLLTGKGSDDVARDLALRYPVEIERVSGGIAEDLVITGAATGAAAADIVVDGAGWIAAIGERTDADDDGNPVGALVAADLCAAEAFKILFARAWPDSPNASQFTAWSGAFSTYSYAMGGPSPAIRPFAIDATLVGAGGVGAGLVLVLEALGPLVSGRLGVVDPDAVELHNLNRLMFATLASARRGEAKVIEARAFLAEKSPRLHVAPFQETFATYRDRVPRRRDRRFPLVVTGLDADDVRHEVQFETPCVLIDGSTGRNANCRVERVRFGESGCLGCTRLPGAAHVGAACDEFPDAHAPSISFLSALPGILAGGEVIKHGLGDDGSLRGYFEHIFLAGPNEDMRGIPAQVDSCLVGCRDPGVLAQFAGKCR
jgi:hypothetical protein